MHGKAALVFLLVIVLALSPLLPAEAADSTSALFDLLERVPQMSFDDGWFGYVDYGVLLNAFPGSRQPASVADYRSLLEEQDWPDTMNAYRSITTGPAEFLLNLDMGERVLAESGIDLFAIERGLVLGNPPAEQIWLEGQFEPDEVETSLLSRGYEEVQSDSGSFRIFAPDGDIAGGTAIDLTQTDPAFIFGGDLGRSWPVMLSDSLIWSTADAAAVQAIAERTETSLLAFPGLRSLLTAVDSAAGGSIGQLHVMALPAIGFDIPDLSDPDLMLPVETGLKRDRPLSPYFALALAQRFEDEAQWIDLALVFDSPETAKAAGDILQYRLLDAVSQRSLQSISESVSGMGGKRLAAVVEAADDGTGVLRIPFRFELTGPAGEPNAEGYSAFRFFMQLFLQRDINWLRIGP